MITFGLTGGIASGKSTATKTFISHGIPMIDADIIARQVVAPGTKGLSLLKNHFDPSFFFEDGTLNRTKLGELVFSNQQELDWINKAMTPLIESFFQKEATRLEQAGHAIIGYDAALIIENGNAGKYRPLVVVGCPQETQLERLMSRNGFTREVAMARIEAQMPFENKKKYADYVIDTSGTIEWSIEQTENIIQILKNEKLSL